MKTCCKCKTKKQAAEFYANKRSKDGLNSFCILCHKADNVARKRINRLNDEFRSAEIKSKSAYRSKNRDAHKDYMKQWHAKNSDSQALYRMKYREENPEYFSNYAKSNAGKVNATTRKRQAAKMQRTPKWIDAVDLFEMECIYSYCSSLRRIGLKYEVDHIIPLQGKNVSGLHVPTNLQVITEKENRSKQNRMEII